MEFSSYQDPQLGEIHFRVNARARRIILRPEASGVVITVPPFCSREAVEQAIEKFRASLAEKQSTLRTQRIDWNFRIETPFLRCSLQQGTDTRFLLRQKEGEAILVCPPNTDFQREEMQHWLQKVLLQMLTKQARNILLPKLRALSVKYGLPYEKHGIRSSKGRWGSCSGRKSINLSCYVLLLPPELVEYVMLHELMHTKEMNHGESFWKGVDAMTGGKAKLLDKRLNQYKTSIFQPI